MQTDEHGMSAPRRDGGQDAVEHAMDGSGRGSGAAGIVAIHALAMQVMNGLLRATPERIDAEIDLALGRIGGFTGADRAYVFQLRDPTVMDNTHEWCAPGIAPAIDTLQGMPIEMVEPWLALMERDLPVHVPDVARLATGSPLRAILEAQDIRSLVAMPMRIDGRLTGFVGFDSVRRQRAYVHEELVLLQSLADGIAATLQRRGADLEIRATRDELARERAFLTSVLATSPAGILVLDDARRVVFANAACEAVLGLPDETLQQPAPWGDLAFSTPDGSPLPLAALPSSRVLATGQPVRDARLGVAMRGGPRRLLQVNATQMPATAGVGPRAVLSVTDITAGAEAEATREAALDEARRATRAKSRFLARMSHEMRTPLNGVLGLSDLLADMIDAPEARRLLALLRDSGGLLLSIINDLLDMSRIEAEEITIEQVAFSPAVLARRIEGVHTLRAADKGLSFRLQAGPGTDRPRIGDPHRLSQILHNLVGNALKFTPAGAVSVTLDSVADALLRIEVADTGIGMSPDEQSRLFEEFAQADGSITRRFGGTGLGMAISQRLVTMMGGTIAVTSAPGQGTTVRVDLPLPMAPEGAALADDNPETGALPVAPSWRGLRVLGADDNATNRLILDSMLRQLGAVPSLCSDGTAALAALRQDRFDLVILDIAMPGLDGVEVLRRLRAHERQRGIDAASRVPVLAYTANAMSHQIAEYLAAGFDGCLTKPLRREALIGELARVAGTTLTEPSG